MRDDIWGEHSKERVKGARQKRKEEKKHMTALRWNANHATGKNKDNEKLYLVTL